ncbi:MAG: glycoside hydrolase family 99-like domain-containing protein [Pseudoxanthomonas sp.]|uniref:glycoside hydrolase family 99-like domain-containing protein n=1 Tax=Pseudoxanthomonas sp. TaxID=1871049 RepID=UPI00258900BD|nr:glycoside hydrolase family 99-like domain-containing protein [Pseudoxanthomonas sp.]MCH2091305.1 glycoside hydrolase family 99-like domain-containing protein [Pseudoxanthomonas sp.]
MSNSLSRQLRTTLFYALRTAFRLTPMSQATRDRLRQRFLDTRGHWVPEGPKGKAPTGELPRRPYVRSDERAIGYVPYEKGELPDPLPATLVAFYLPQFHTIPENDEWWGKGFTEWRNVTRALPQFEGHYQPKLPGDLGFYDLRNVEVMHEQARLAREYGISAFCFYFYWFGGKTLLETPLRNWLNDKSIDLKFCLCWANEKWTRTWDGRGDEILIDQKHSPEDDIAFIEHVAEYMRDPRYLRVDGKPMLVVYRPGLFPDMAASATRWRAWCAEHGIGEIHLAYVRSFETPEPRDLKFDSSIQFPPNGTSLRSQTASLRLLNPHYAGEALDWRDLSTSPQADKGARNQFPGVTPCWDNEPRRPGRSRTLLHSSPRRYRDWLADRISGNAAAQGFDLVFINAWNEWAEGAMLEPDARLGYANLRATRDALNLSAREPKAPQRSEGSTHAVIHAWYPEVLQEILATLSTTTLTWRLLVTTTHALENEVRDVLAHSSMEFKLLTLENRGRDILPFLVAAESLLESGVDFALKLHTKRSPHRKDGDTWRRDLVSKLAGTGQAETAVSILRSRPNVGMIAPAGHVIGLDTYWGANRTSTKALAQRLGLPDIDAEGTTFASGSMFWVRLDAVRPILDAHLLPGEFETEDGQIDGTLAHAMERMFKHSVENAGYEVLALTDDQGVVTPGAPSTDRYPHAGPG